MLETLRERFTGWVPSRDMRLMAKLCKRFNQGRIYEIFGEYCGLTSHVLDERHACGWLHYESGKLDGFALGRRRQGALRMREFFVFEEVWGPCEGTSNELAQPCEDDIRRVNEFRELIDSLGRFPVVLRAAVDNHFAHLISRTLEADWVNGLILAEKTLNGKVELPAPVGYKLRMFEDRDEYYMSNIHKAAFEEVISPETYRAWATATNCHAVMATVDKHPVGFIIAEKRRCGSLGDFTIAVHPTHQGKGIGTALLKTAFNIFVDVKVKTVIADYLMLNRRAHNLYQRHKLEPKRIYNYFLYDQSFKKESVTSS